MAKVLKVTFNYVTIETGPFIVTFARSDSKIKMIKVKAKNVRTPKNIFISKAYYKPAAKIAVAIFHKS